jgi:hypothetical protein
MSFKEKRKAIFKKLATKDASVLKTAVIEPIHPKFPFADNGIWIMIAVPGTGKTYNYLGLATDQQWIKKDAPWFEFVVICSTSHELDKTVKTFSKAITDSKLIPVEDTELLEFLDVHKTNIKLHNTVMEYLHNNFKNPSDKMQKLIEEYNLTTKNKQITFIAKVLNQLQFKTYPCRMLLIMDDFANHPLMRRRGDDLSARIRKLRHYQITVIICVQRTKDVTRDMKAFATDFVLFPGINEEDFIELLRESSASYFSKNERQLLWNRYRTIKNQRTMLRIHTKAKKVIIEHPDDKDDKSQHNVRSKMIKDI